MTSASNTQAGSTLFGLNYYYKQDSTNCPSAPAGNDGLIQCVTDTMDSGRNATYTYDALARLSTGVKIGYDAATFVYGLRRVAQPLVEE